MRVGVVILPQFDLTETQRRWKAVQDMGFAHGWTYDHLAWRDLADEPWFATFPTLTVAALATETLRIGTWVTSPNFRHPVTLAKELMTLDVLSGGRVIAGVGAGGLGWDAGVFGRPELAAGDRIRRLDEFVTLTDLLLRQPETSWQGSFFEAVRARMVPGCVQSPRLPLMVAANGPKGMSIAARYDGWVTTGPGATDDLDGWWTGVAGLAERFDAALATTGRASGDTARDSPALRASLAALAPDARSGRASGDTAHDSPALRASRRYLDLDSAPLYALSSAEAFADAAGRAAALGFTDVITHWPRASRHYVGDEKVLGQVASTLGPGGTVG